MPKRKLAMHKTDPDDEDSEMADTGASAPIGPVTLTDNTTEKDINAIYMRHGKAEPPPPGVRRIYWRRVFTRADRAFQEDIHEVIQRRIDRGQPVDHLQGWPAEHAAEMAAKGKMYEHAVMFLLHDLCWAHVTPVTIDEDRGETRWVREVRDRKLALLETRKYLTDEFYAWMRARGYDIRKAQDRDGVPGKWTWVPVGYDRTITRGLR